MYEDVKMKLLNLSIGIKNCWVYPYGIRQNVILGMGMVIWEETQLFTKLTSQLPLKTVLKVEHYKGGRWFIHVTKHPEENQLLSVKHTIPTDLK